MANGGNYTDANGQQWIADEVDLARGVYVQRVGGKVLTGTEVWTEGSSVLNGMHRFYIYVGGMRAASAGPGLCTHYERSALASHEITSECVRFGDSNPALFFFTSTITSTDAWVAYVTEQYANGNPIEVQYILAEPVETALTDVELQAYLAMHSNKPTTVLNDAGAHMVLEYAADPKTYIDNKLAALVAAQN